MEIERRILLLLFGLLLFKTAMMISNIACILCDKNFQKVKKKIFGDKISSEGDKNCFQR